MSESSEQCAVVKWFRLQHPKKTILAIPNGAHLAGTPKSRACKMARMKAEGLLVGTADLFIAQPVGPFAGLWVEMKAGKNQATDAQCVFGLNMVRAGYQWHCCNGADDAIEAIKNYLRGGDKHAD